MKRGALMVKMAMSMNPTQHENSGESSNDTAGSPISIATVESPSTLYTNQQYYGDLGELRCLHSPVHQEQQYCQLETPIEQQFSQHYNQYYDLPIPTSISLLVPEAEQYRQSPNNCLGYCSPLDNVIDLQTSIEQPRLQQRDEAKDSHNPTPSVVNFATRVLQEQVLQHQDDITRPSTSTGKLLPTISHQTDENSDPYATDGSSDVDFNPNDFDLDQQDALVSEEKIPDITKSRKRKRNPDNWRRNRIKKLRNSGKAYVNWKSKQVSERIMKPPCPTTCRLKCQTKFQEKHRVQIFQDFWKLGDINYQREFVLRNLTVKPTKHPRKKKDAVELPEGDTCESRRKLSYFYTFPQENCPVNTIKVCQTFFLNTLGISHQIVKTVVKKTHHSNSISPQADLRGKVQCNSRLPKHFKDSVRHHIKSFALIESHYCRKNSTKKYLPPDLNISKMYRLYKTYCSDNNINTIASYAIYREVFNNEFNLGFFIPKKDQCDFCNKLSNSSPSEKEELRSAMEAHLKNKDLSRANKELDKERAKTDNSFCMAIYDLQKTLLCPKAEVSLLYYRRKLACYNLTVYDAANKQGYCYMWPESLACRGACEIGSCILSFIDEMVRNGIKEFSFYSDNCTGQNRNRFIYCLYMYCAAKYGVKITHSFLEKGHTQNECDSVHGVIERAAKKIPIFSPQQWYTLARTACKVRPYKIKEMAQADFYDLKDLLAKTTKNWDKTELGCKVIFNNLKVIMVDPKCPNQLNVKYSFEEDFIKINTLELKRSHQKLDSLETYQLRMLRSSPVPIPAAKYKDLLFLCENKVIPTEYHNFFTNLQASNIPEQETDED
ncbi:uncharacterized protein LOC126892938 [Diabrotica virgifera virgifera]|uniref:DUF7869 domain-containing protein n=1 Tax=Diabrotica virgifera virgifera TaxID=50390 RepID=A0ABM5KA24_DIAVI|nr:uncharacterized protein LOC114330871 [Diabrotica virgifera virgifera]XP_028143425.2 uncharacterized protein LOC114337218 [Diabrotica virgifera virgifera]XP_050497369.1 uncharacterized protein LOC126878602 [Diabrotica virgifera virgifera]XP_050497900.1 uncharacterized protein LOC126879053 [Diabrotica virgifera virgifera]XP_050498750.1 uncharacterized protein LOC126879618 [Diabrotica virgifera virgifera]XP_050499042.1 uncharacterized protein LOC126879816 [Diabrotica virgifera virgifera]XP_05